MTGALAIAAGVLVLAAIAALVLWDSRRFEHEFVARVTEFRDEGGADELRWLRYLTVVAKRPGREGMLARRHAALVAEAISAVQARIGASPEVSESDSP